MIYLDANFWSFFFQESCVHFSLVINVHMISAGLVCEFGIEVVVACLPMLLQNIFAKKIHAEFQLCCKNIIAKVSYKTLHAEFFIWVVAFFFDPLKLQVYPNLNTSNVNCKSHKTCQILETLNWTDFEFGLRSLLLAFVGCCKGYGIGV